MVNKNDDLNLTAGDYHIGHIQQKVHSNAVQHGFWGPVGTNETTGDVVLLGGFPDPMLTNIPTKLMLIVTELGEAMEAWRDAGKESTSPDLSAVYDDKGKPEGFGVELADAVIRIMDLCEYLGIDLGELIALKHNYNVSRPFKHGRGA